MAIIFYHFDIDRLVVFVNIKMMRPLFCQPVFQFLNSLPPIILLFSLLNTNEIFEKCQTSFGVADVTDVNIAMYNSTYTERRSASENCIIDNTHCIVFSF